MIKILLNIILCLALNVLLVFIYRRLISLFIYCLIRSVVCLKIIFVRFMSLFILTIQRSLKISSISINKRTMISMTLCITFLKWTKRLILIFLFQIWCIFHGIFYFSSWCVIHYILVFIKI